MMPSSDAQHEMGRSATSHTLLERVRQSEAEAWRRFVDVYGPLVTYWCRRAGLRNDDAADVLQETFRAVARGIEGFHHDDTHGTFRGWLRTITTNKIRDWARTRKRNPSAVGGDDAYRKLAEAADPLSVGLRADEPDPEADAAERSIVFRGALQLIRAEFNDRTWQAFWRTAVEDAPAAVVAGELNLTVANVYQMKSRVLRRLRKELHGLES